MRCVSGCRTDGRPIFSPLALLPPPLHTHAHPLLHSIRAVWMDQTDG